MVLKVRVGSLRSRPAGDEGTSLMELIIGMAIMAIFMSMFTGAIVLMTSTANKVEAVTSSAGQVNQAFLRMDKLVRYASMISAPARSTVAGGTGDWYVELSIPNSAGAAICTQLRDDLTTQQLQQRTWNVTSDQVASAASAWQPIASSITNTAADVPFVAGTNTKSLFKQLQINLTSTIIHPTKSTSSASATFTALNSTLIPTTPCQDWGRP
jgi:hypothetical protein